jgi:hypothetical protein
MWNSFPCQAPQPEYLCVNDYERTEGGDEKRVAKEAILFRVRILHRYSCTKTKKKQKFTKKYGIEIQYKDLRNVELTYSDIIVQMSSKKIKLTLYKGHFRD